MGDVKAIRLRVTMNHMVPEEANCSGCDYMEGGLYCRLFRRVIRLDGTLTYRTPVPECMKARDAAMKKRKGGNRIQP